jgi:hypothetical protein
LPKQRFPDRFRPIFIDLSQENLTFVFNFPKNYIFDLGLTPRQLEELPAESGWLFGFLGRAASFKLQAPSCKLQAASPKPTRQQELPSLLFCLTPGA